MNNPVVVWARGFLRIVAVERSSPFMDKTPTLIVEYKDRDALGEPAWTPIELRDLSMETRIVVYLIATSLAATSELHPKWVRDFLKSDLEKYESVDTLHDCGEIDDDDDDDDEDDDDGENKPS